MYLTAKAGSERLKQEKIFYLHLKENSEDFGGSKEEMAYCRDMLNTSIDQCYLQMRIVSGLDLLKPVLATTR